jgi:Flp pilus assembly protein TadG
MHTKRGTKRNGQALIMVTVALIAMFGLLGLAVDLGWEFYVHKTAQAATDSAALAAVKEARAGVRGTTGPYSCGANGFTCQPTQITCSTAGGNLATGCQFAAANNFADGGADGRQTVRIEANVGSPPSAPGVTALYWVHVVATETVYQLFSGILGNTTGVVSAEATAALLSVAVPGSIILLNRQYDTSAAGTGKNLMAQGSATISAPHGILMAANAGMVGHTGGSSNVTAGFTYIRGSGTADWTYQNGFPDSAWFQDPESGKGQPPMDLSQPSQRYFGVPGGNLTTAVCGGACPSGNYFATSIIDGKTVATGNPITVSDSVKFDGGSFGGFLFFGGVTFNGSVTLGPGRYVLAGVRSGNPLLDIGNNAIYGGSGSDAGRIFILTNSSYGGDATMASVVAGVPNKNWPSLVLGDTTLKSGNGTVSLYGLTKDLSLLPSDLRGFTNIVVWQDQRNSTILYDSAGYVRNSPDCGGDGADRACPNTGQTDPQLTIWGGNQSSTTTIAGIVYQPRGAWTQIHSGTNFNGALTLITGALDMQGSPTLNLSGDGLPITTLTSALVH